MRPYLHPASALVFVVLLAAAGAQEPHPANQAAATPTIRSSSTLVIVPTLVRAPANDLIQPLQAGDFKVSDDGVEQKASLEDAERQPIAMVVLMQIGGAAPRQFAAYANLATMVDSMAGSSAHRVALVTFDSEPDSLWEFTSNIDSLKQDMAHPEQGDGGAAILDAIHYGIGLLQQQPPNYRRLLLLLSQPQDDGSKVHAEEVVRSLGENNVTILSVTFSPEKTWLKDQFTKPRRENPPYQLTPGEPSLTGTFDLGTPLGVALKAMRGNAAAEIATLSGGESVEFGDKRDLEQKLAELTNHIASRYMLSFRPTSSVAGFHTLRVTIPGHPEMEISARGGYWLSGPASAAVAR